MTARHLFIYSCGVVNQIKITLVLNQIITINVLKFERGISHLKSKGFGQDTAFGVTLMELSRLPNLLGRQSNTSCRVDVRRILVSNSPHASDFNTSCTCGVKSVAFA